MPTDVASDTYDPFGRLTNVVDSLGGSRTHGYDGQSRLTHTDESGTATQTRYVYGSDDTLVYERRSQPLVTLSETYRTGGWRRRTEGGVTTVTEQVLPFVTLVDGQPHHPLLDTTGEARWVLDPAQQVHAERVSGVYGRPVWAPGGWASWSLDGLHGSDPDTHLGVVHHGARHALLTHDGKWMQPEPLLYLGPAAGGLARPLAFGGTYAVGNPLGFSDRSGYSALVTTAGAVGTWKLVGAALTTGAGLVVTGGSAVAGGIAAVGTGGAAVLTNHGASGAAATWTEGTSYVVETYKETNQSLAATLEEGARYAEEQASQGGETNTDAATKPRLSAKERRARDRARTREMQGKPADWTEPASEARARHEADKVEREHGKDARRQMHDAKEAGEGDRSLEQLQQDAADAGQ